MLKKKFQRLKALKIESNCQCCCRGPFWLLKLLVQFQEDIIEEIKKEEVDAIADKKAAAAALIGKKLNATLDFNKFNEFNKSLDVSKECEKVAEEICEASEDIIDQDEDLSLTEEDVSMGIESLRRKEKNVTTFWQSLE